MYKRIFNICHKPGHFAKECWYKKKIKIIIIKIKIIMIKIKIKIKIKIIEKRGVHVDNLEEKPDTYYEFTDSIMKSTDYDPDDESENMLLSAIALRCYRK